MCSFSVLGAQLLHAVLDIWRVFQPLLTVFPRMPFSRFGLSPNHKVEQIIVRGEKKFKYY